MSEPTPTCLVCPATSLHADGGAGDVAFFACPRCGRRFAREGDGPLVERWLGPLSIALYGVMYADDPAEHAERVAVQFVTQSAADAPERLQEMVAAIDDELRAHRQPVKEILPGTAGSEAQLREYLRRFADLLRDDAWVACQLEGGRNDL